MADLESLIERLEAVVHALERVPTAADVLDVATVRARYGFADDRAAYKAMHEAGAFHMGGRLYVHLGNLHRLEAARVQRVHEQEAAPSRRKRGAGRPAMRGPLEPGFWK